MATRGWTSVPAQYAQNCRPAHQEVICQGNASVASTIEHDYDLKGGSVGNLGFSESAQTSYTANAQIGSSFNQNGSVCGDNARRRTPVFTWHIRNVVALRKLLLLGALSGVAALLAGCSAPPLGTGSGAGVCTPAPQVGKPVDMGLFDLKNQGTAPVTVRSVSLPNAHGMAMTEAWLVPSSTSGPQLGAGPALSAGNVPALGGQGPGGRRCHPARPGRATGVRSAQDNSSRRALRPAEDRVHRRAWRIHPARAGIPGAVARKVLFKPKLAKAP